MGADTKIEWADHTFNPWTGCQAVSPACDHCYAEQQAKRAPKTFGGWGPHAERKRTSESYWRQPLLWNKRAAKEGRRPRVFCASMADVFDNAVPEAWREDLWRLIWATEHLDWLLLTKRPQNITKMLPWLGRDAPWPNVWLGTTVENQAEADRRIPHLLAAPAAKRFLSCEPLLGPVDLTVDGLSCSPCLHCSEGQCIDPGTNANDCRRCDGTGKSDEIMLDWVIAGGESGPHARPTHPDWFRSLRDQCQAAGVPYFFKQWGEWAPGDAFGMQQGGPVTDRHGSVRDWMRHYVVCEDRADRLTTHSFTEHATDLVYRVGKHRAGATLDGREWREVPGGNHD